MAPGEDGTAAVESRKCRLAPLWPRAEAILGSGSVHGSTWVYILRSYSTKHVAMAGTLAGADSR